MSSPLKGSVVPERIRLSRQRGMDNKWRYFCGICWRKISELQDMAKAILLADEQLPSGTV
jgi:hypothetical protein